MKLLFASAEIYPYAKTGGLADVAQALPKALSRHIEVVSVMPLYDFIDRQRFDIRPTTRSFSLRWGEEEAAIKLFEVQNHGVRTIFVWEKRLCGRNEPYGDFDDNDLRFGIFSRVIGVIAHAEQVQAVHLNDWHTALAAMWLRDALPAVRIVFSIHNLAYQGIFEAESVERLGIPNERFTPEGVEFYGKLNCMKAGIAYSDAVTTVSPRYAAEILTPALGCGLDGFLRAHEEKLTGILNGIDTELFDPEHDQALPCRFDAEHPQKKAKCKAKLIRELGLKDDFRPLFIFIARLTEQKGVDVLIDVMPKLLRSPVNVAVIGDGDTKYASRLESIARESSRFHFFEGMNEDRAHRYYAAADFLWMPSRFEPCGLNQMIAARYGAVPIVGNVGGLHDSVEDIDAANAQTCIRGIVIEHVDSASLMEAQRRALALYRDGGTFMQIIRHNMRCHHSFDKRAKRYLSLYEVSE